jgi:MYXO-CTERM domain-containing protein
MRSALVLLLVASAPPALAATINVGPTDDYHKIEAAQPGDVVLIAPGTYKFRVDFETPGTPAAPITVQAADPSNRPVWDLTGIPVSSAPGSYTAGDKGRGCWQFHGGYYVVDGIVFKNCNDSSSAGLRVINVPSVHIRNCLFQGNTNGVTGAGDDLVIEFSEFDANGKVFMAGDNAAHQIYIFGGQLTVRFSYFHDSPEGQSFHVRARQATLEYNWFTRPGSYTGDMMTCEYLCGGTGTQAITMSMLLRGNVIVQGTPSNHSQIIAQLNDASPPNSVDGTGSTGNMDLTMVSNTVIGTTGYNNDLVHSVNDATLTTAVHLTDNLVETVKVMNLVENPGVSVTTLDGTNNWVSTGTDVGTLSGSVFGTDPMLSSSYVPQAGSPVIGKAAAPGANGPAYEYYKDETTKLMGRVRASVLDVGAFESTTMSQPFGPGGAPAIDGGTSGDGGGGGTTGPPTTGGGHSTQDSGCGCSLTGSTPLLLWPVVLIFVALAVRRRA